MSAPTSGPAPFAFDGRARAGDVASIAFADEQNGVYGYGRIEVDGRASVARSLVAVFAQDRPLAVVAGEAPVAGAAAGTLDGGALLLQAGDGGWTARFGGGPDGAGAFALRSAPLLGWLDVAATIGERHIARVDVEGEMQTPGGATALQGTGQLTFARGVGAPGAALTRDVAVWVADRSTIEVSAHAQRSGKGHDGENLHAVLVDHDPPAVQPIEISRLSTTYDADGRPLRVGIELWATEESAYARRAAGDVLCTATLVTPAGRWDCAFLRWRMEGDTGIGPYALWRAAGKR